MVNGYINNSQIQPQIYAKQQIKPQAQSVELEPQEQMQNAAMPYQYPAYAPKMDSFSTIPNGASGVNINIISPSVYGANRAEIPYAPIYNYPVANTIAPAPIPPAPQMSKSHAEPQEEKQTEKTKKKTVIPLTDEYIQTVENYMKSSNEQIRLMGAKEILARFREDDSRRNDAALTALLNMSLQDKSNNVRVVGMTSIAAGYSAGDKNTAILLDKIQHSTSNYSEDALLAANALMKMSSAPQKVEVPEN